PAGFGTTICTTFDGKFSAVAKPANMTAASTAISLFMGTSISARFGQISAGYNPARRQSACDGRSPVSDWQPRGTGGVRALGRARQLFVRSARAQAEPLGAVEARHAA